MIRRYLGSLALALFLAAPLPAQDQPGFEFQTVDAVRTTPVKDQARTGTCWSFATTSFIETELLRLGHEPLDISEMFFVRVNYPPKVANYVRMHGQAAIGEGSLAGDVMRAVRRYGMVPEAVYPGRRYGGTAHDHSELHAILQAAVDAVLARPPLSPVWPDAVGGILDAYLGDLPLDFTYQGRSYTPLTFASSFGVDADDYVELTSFTHHPFDTWVAVEIPDNWARNRSYNVPLDELMVVIDRALASGFSVAWDGDVSERSFCHADGVALLPAKTWDERTDAERAALCKRPEGEVEVTQDRRQAWFDDHSSTDDHLMHLVGTARDQNGTRYYVTKNSWGETGTQDGYVYMSESYVRAKTISVVVHRDALPQDLAGRLSAGDRTGVNARP